jgi:hypothetical protein
LAQPLLHTAVWLAIIRCIAALVVEILGREVAPGANGLAFFVSFVVVLVRPGSWKAEREAGRQLRPTAAQVALEFGRPLLAIALLALLLAEYAI